MHARLTFVGGAGMVTGSCYLLEYGDKRLLIDCGLFQGSKAIKELNYRPFPFDPAGIDAVLLTHAHIDHSGLLPKLCRHGFRGRVIATEGTRDLLTFMLPDAGNIQETEVKRLNRRRVQRGEEPVSPIYTAADAKAMLRRVNSVPLAAWVQLSTVARARFWPAGHILGAASIEIELGAATAERPLKLLFSGDLGPDGKSFHAGPEAPAGFDCIVIEATYGDRERPHITADSRRDILAQEVRTAMARGGNLLIPAFAVERTQELLFDLGVLFRDHALPDVPVFIDSPLATRVTEVFAAHTAELGEAAGAKRPFAHPNFRFVETVEQSKGLNRIRSGAIIVAASGMCDAGRIRHHLKANLWRRQSTVLLVGFQAPGTLGQLLQDGADAVRIHGEEIRVEAAIRKIDVYTAHADRRELIKWLVERQPVRQAVVVTHGEPAALALLQAAIQERVGSIAVLDPQLDSSLVLDAQGAPRLERGKPRIDTAVLRHGHDWHNDYAAFLLKLSDYLRHSQAQEDNEALLWKLERALDEARADRTMEHAANEIRVISRTQGQ